MGMQTRIEEQHSYGHEHGQEQESEQAQAAEVSEPAKSPTAKSSVVRKKRATAARKSSTDSVAAANPDQRTVSISLPLETYNWFEEQTAKAPYEPTLAKYLQWELRELEKKQRAQAEKEKAGAWAELTKAEKYTADAADLK